MEIIHSTEMKVPAVVETEMLQLLMNPGVEVQLWLMQEYADHKIYKPTAMHTFTMYLMRRLLTTQIMEVVIPVRL